MNRRVVTGVLKARDGKFEGTVHTIVLYENGEQCGVSVLDIDEGDWTVYRWI